MSKRVNFNTGIYILSLSLLSCSTTKLSNKHQTQKSAHHNSAANENVIKSETEISPKNFKIKPGEALQITYPLSAIKDDNFKGKVYCKDRWIPTFVKNDELHFFVAETYFSRLKPFQCWYKHEQKKIIIANIEVSDKYFPSERLKVDQKRVFLSQKHLKRVRKEQKFLNSVYKASPQTPLFSHSFLEPLDSLVTSIYGSKRIFNNKKQTQHLGTDYRAGVGVSIVAANSGRVVVARDLFYTGYTVTIDHGLGIFTIYGHLSKLVAREGEYVPRGALLGLAGKSGRVTGPHLHWGVKVNGHFIEGSSLVKTSLASENNISYGIGSIAEDHD